MAAFDLYGADAQKIRNQYKTSLGRDASDDEVSGWLGGSYGGGGVNDWLNQIAGSHEAQQYNKPAQSPVPPVLGQNPNTSSPMVPQNDPWAQATAGLTSVYKNSLGRDPGEGDIEKWLTGQFGYGSGLGDYDKFVKAIMSSPEARAYRPQGTPQQGGYQDLNWWQQQGVPNIDIFDPMTGQIKPGWQRTAKGYERTGGAQNVAGPQGGNFQQWFQTLTQGKAPTPQSLKAMEPILNQYGIKLGPLNARGFTDGIILPDGTFIDVIIGATENGGQGWGWLLPGPGGGGLPDTRLPSSQYSDPHTKLLEEMLLGRIGQLQSGQDQGYQQLMAFLQQRFNDLQGPGRTGAEQEIIRTQALDPIERDRQAARKQVLERISARGFTPDSGVAQQLLRDVDALFDAERSASQTTLASDELYRREGRQQYAEGLAAQMYQIPQARAVQALGYAGALADLGPQRLQLAMQAMGQGGSPQSMFQSLMALASMNQNMALLNSQNSGRLWNGLGSMAAILMNAGR